ncbi:MLXPL protein, partial [Brachypodius atriceps]|nr:MLXPL protein [Brachypodius atriceps]
SQVIHSGHFMVSCPHSDSLPRRRHHRAEPEPADPRNIDPTLTRLFECMSLEYSGKLVSPKWKNFKGLRLLCWDKIRLNNVIWRAWYIQCEYGPDPTLSGCGVLGLGRSATTPCPAPQAVVLEGNYWKRRIEVVMREYHKWRIYYKKRLRKSTREGEISSPKRDEDVWRPTEKWCNQLFCNVVPMLLGDEEEECGSRQHFDLDTFLSDISDTLFTMTQTPSTHEALPKDAYVGNADMIQPDLAPLQPSLDDMDISGKRQPGYGVTSEHCVCDVALGLWGEEIEVLGASQPSYDPKGHFFIRAGNLGARITHQLHAKLHRAGMWGGHHGVTGLSLCEVVWQSSVPVSQCLQTNPQMRKHFVSVAGAGERCEADGGVLMAGVREQSSPVPCWQHAPGRIAAGHWGWAVWAGAPCLHEAPENIPVVKRTGSSSRGASLFSGAIQQGRDCSSSGAGRGWPSPGAGKVTPAPTAPRSSAHLLPALSAKQDLALDTPCPMGAGLMSTAPVSPQSTIPKVPATLLSRMAQMSPGLAPGSSPSQVLLHRVGTQPGPLQVPKTEQLSPTLACGDDWPKPSQASPGPATRLGTGISLHQPLSHPRRPESSKLESRRITHISAEQKRRFNIKLGFTTLHSLVSTLSAQPSIKVSKATTLQKTAEYICKLQQERAALQDEAQRLREQIEELNGSINLCQEQLPATGVPITRQRFDHMRRMFDEYVRSSTLQNWKFWIFSTIIRPLFESFNGMVSTASMESLTQTSLAWLDQHCSLPALRPTVLSSLRQLSISTSILSDPARVPEQAARAVAALGRPG